MSLSPQVSWHRYAAVVAAAMGLWLAVVAGLAALDLGDPGEFVTSDYDILAIPFTFGLVLLALSVFLLRRRRWARLATVWLLGIWLAVEVVHIGIFVTHTTEFSSHAIGVLWIGFAFSLFPALFLLLLVNRPVVEHFTAKSQEEQRDSR